MADKDRRKLDPKIYRKDTGEFQELINKYGSFEENKNARLRRDVK